MPSASPLVTTSPARDSCWANCSAVSRPSPVGLRLPTIASCGRDSGVTSPCDVQHERRVGDAAPAGAGTRGSPRSAASVAVRHRATRGRWRCRRGRASATPPRPPCRAPVRPAWRRLCRSKSVAGLPVASQSASWPACRPGTCASASHCSRSSMKQKAYRASARQAFAYLPRTAMKASAAPQRVKSMLPPSLWPYCGCAMKSPRRITSEDCTTSP